MSTYNKQFKEEAVRLSDEIGVKKAADQLGVPYYTLADWRSQRKQHGEKTYIGSGHARAVAGMNQREIELERENAGSAVAKWKTGFTTLLTALLLLMIDVLPCRYRTK